MPGRFPSPFVGKGAGAAGKRWPGGILTDTGGGSGEKGVKEEEKPGESGRRRARRTAGGGDSGMNKGGANNAPVPSLAAGYQFQTSNLPQQVQAPKPPAPDRSVLTAAGGPSILGQGAQIEKLPAETGTCVFPRDVTFN